jgi:uncharacterized membrane protein
MQASPRLGAAALAMGAAGWLGAIAAAPVLPVALGAVVYAVGSLVCHQRPERSFHWHGAQMAVCARCAGIYAGAAVALAFALVSGPVALRGFGDTSRVRRWLVWSSVPTVLTVGLEWAGWWHASGLVRAIAGAPLGGAAALVVAAAVSTLHYGQCLPRAAAPPQSRLPRTRI